MRRNLWLVMAIVLAFTLTLAFAVSVGANPPSPGDRTAQSNPVDLGIKAPTSRTKPIDQPNLKDFLRNRERMRLVEAGKATEAADYKLAGTDRVLVILVEYAGTDTFTWNPGDEWDPLGRADPSEAVVDDDGNVVVGDCSNIITQTQTFVYSGPLHNQLPRPLSAEDRSGDTIWTEDFSNSWFNSFMFGNGIRFNYTRVDGSVVDEDFTGMSVKQYYMDISGGTYDIEGDVFGWLQLPHSTWYYGADECPGARSGGGANAGAIPGAGNNRQLVRDSLDALNAISNTIPGFDWANYDLDGDGVIDRLWIVHSGYGEEDGTTLLNRTDYGEASIWSHSSSVTPPYPVGNGISAGPYIVMPENGGIGVFAHEYGHNLGAMDLYAYDQGETSAGFWTIMADDWTGYPIGYQPPGPDPMHLDWWGWLNPMVISNPTQTYEVTLGQATSFPGGDDVYRAVKIELPDGILMLPSQPWQGSYYWWGGKEDLSNAMMKSVNPIALPATPAATLSFDLANDIEEEWDFLWIQVSTDGANWTTLTNANTICEHDASWIGGNYGFPDDLCAAGIGGFSGMNDDFPDPQTQTFNLSAFAGQSVYLRFWYMTDWASTNNGPFMDNVKVMAGTNTLFADDAENGDANWVYTLPWERSDGTRSFTHNFYLQWRNVSDSGGYDSALGDPRWRFGPANSGLIVWYNNNYYSDNEVWHYLPDYPGFGPKGRMLVLDAHPEPYRDPDYVGTYPNEFANIAHRGQMRDAPFSLEDSIAFAHKDPYRLGANWHDYPGRPAVSAFHDALGYYPGAELKPGSPYGQTTPRWMTKQWDASTVMPATAFYGVNAPGYNGSSVFRFNCSTLNAAGQLLCYGYGGGLGYPGSTGNPGEIAAQYGWHVQILSQTDSTATVKIWNSMTQVDAAISVTPAVAAVGSTVSVDVRNLNAGVPLTNVLALAPIETGKLAYVDGSVYGGAFPIGIPVEEAAAAFAKGGVQALKNSVTPESGVVAVAWVGDQMTGEEVAFGYQATVQVGAADGSWPLYETVVQLDSQQQLATAMTTLTVPELNSYEVTLQDGLAGYDGTADTYLNAWSSMANYGVGPNTWVRQPGVKSSLLKFDLTGISDAAQVVQAKMGVFVTYGGSNPVTMATYELLKPWTETEATWVQAAAGMPWEMPGATGPSDRAPSATDSVTSSGGGYWVWFDVTAVAQGWIQHPATNNGVVIMGSGNVNSELAMISADYPISWLRPQFRLVYKAP